MSGNNANNQTQQQQQPAPPKIDHAKAGLGAQFIKRIANDIPMGNDVRSMDELVDKLFPGGDASFDQNRLAAADKLIESLGELRRGDIKTISEEAAIHIKSAFADPSITTTDQLAKQLNDKDYKNELWHLFAAGDHDFAVSITAQQLEALRAMLNKYAPGLGDVIVGLVDVGAQRVTEEQTVKNTLKDAYDVMTHGSEDRLAEFMDVDKKSILNDQGVRVEKDFEQPFLPPTSFSNAKDFFTEEGLDGNFSFYNDDAQVLNKSFNEMILKPLEEQGVVTFTGSEAEQEAARQDFTDYSKQLMLGAPLGEEFVQTLEQNGTVEFESEAARDSFIAFAETIDTRAYNEDEIAQKIFDHLYGDNQAQRMENVLDDPRHTNSAILNQMRIQDPAGASLVKDSGGMVDYRQFKQGVMDATDHFIPVTGRGEYADKVAALEHPHISINFEREVYDPYKATVSDAGPPDVGDSLKVDKFDANQTGTLDYGASVAGRIDVNDPSGFKVLGADDKAVFSFDPGLGHDKIELLSVSEIDAGNGTKMLDFDTEKSVTAEELKELLGDTFRIQMVTHNDADDQVAGSHKAGYYIESLDGRAAFYVGPQSLKDIEPGTMDAMKKDLEDGVHNKQASPVANANAAISSDPSAEAPIIP